MDFFIRLFDTSDFPARWECGRWTAGHGWLHILSDLGVWGAYVAIPCVLAYFVLRRRSLPFRTIFFLFGAFILACGTTHLMEAIIFWWPAYRLAGLIKLFTALVSWATVLALVPIVPRALALRSPEELEREVAERRRSEDALRLANARLDLAVRGSNIGIWEIDMPDGDFRNGRVDFTNIWEQLGYDRPESSHGFAARMTLVHPDDRERVERALEGYVAGQTAELEVEHRARHKDGSSRWMLTRGVAMRDPAGRPVRLIGSSVDITDHKRAEELLRESEERFRGTFENAAVGIAHKDASGRFLRLNTKYCGIVGYSRSELLERTFLDITHPDDLAAEMAQYRPLMRGELPSYSLEKRYLRKDGSVVWIDVTLSLQRDPAGAPAYAIAILQDISERKRLEADVRRAMEAAESANRAKDGFLANVSHEIRTPMNAILGMTELVLDTTLTEDQRQCLETVKSAGDSLLNIINDLLDFAKIEAGKLELDLANFSLRSMLGDTLRALAVRAHKQGLELLCHVQPDVPDALVGDAGRLRQVLVNLVGNAIKFTEHGEVVVSVAATGPVACCAEPTSGPLVATEVELLFSVSDTGIGIPADKQQRIFRAFEQEDTSTTRRYGGTGLGLSIASCLVPLMDGKITLDSEPGRGSTFAFTARFGRQPQPTEPAASRPPALLRDLAVLVVDDNATNRRILQEWLRSWQMSPTAAGDGLSALGALWHAATRGRPFSLVLLDLCMPDTDGLTVAARVRQRAELASTRIILLTSGDRPGDLVRSRELRIDAHLLKPVPQDELFDTICRVMSQGDGPAAPAPQSALAPSPTARPLHVLVAEDNEFNVRHLERLLRRKGHRVHLASNGREALELVGQAAFDVMLLDLHMPQMDGFGVIGAIRQREKTAGGHLPVIALTARSRKEDRERCLAAGMDEYLAKPVRAAELFAAIDRVVAALAPSRAAEPAAAGASLLDPAALLAACGDDARGLRELCQDLHTYAPPRLATLRDALTAGDAPRLREAAHKLCGLLSAFSTRAGNAAADLEELAERGQVAEAPPLVEELHAMTRALLLQTTDVTMESLQRQAGTADAGA